jgi:cytochrome o ubiquinol oxidase subunit II
VRKKKINLLFLLCFAAFVLLVFLLMQPLLVLYLGDTIDLLFPSGAIALKQRNLLFFSQLLMLLVIIPVYILTFIFSWKYRASNPKAKYEPHLVDNTIAEIFWWGVPLVMTLILAWVTWVKTHELDPFTPIESNKKPVTIKVVALQWKWLFIYPEENIATVNFIQFPEETPIHFVITSDAPMNSFWIPSLGGQIYAMPNMRTELFLIANESGDFRGSSANISGEGFAGMHFIARASTEKEYTEWLASAKKSSTKLNTEAYKTLKAPSKDHPVTLYQLEENGLFDHIINQYMHP